MGSFANSIHVQANNAAVVAEAVRNQLRAEGYEPTDEAPADRDLWGHPSVLRAVRISESKDGWVAVLDSDLLSIPAFAAALSGRLETHSLQVMVNDSDSWHYQLHRDGQQIDSFDSSGGEDSDDSTDLAGMFGGGDLADLQRNLVERARQMQEQVQQLIPPELRAIQERWMTGKATPEEIQKYTQWMQTEMPRMKGSIKDILGDFSSAFSRNRKTSDDRHFQPNVDHLRPLLASGVTDEQVRRVLGTQAVFAEETLGEFLPLLGISHFYAYTSYRYAGECTEEDLSGESVRLAEHLKFKRAGGKAKNGLRIVR